MVIATEEGIAVAIEDQAFTMGGGYIAEFEPAGLVEPRSQQVRRVEEGLGYAIPERCVGANVYGVWYVGQTTPR